MATSGNVKVIFNNKRANFDFELLERFEAGLVLTGTEIKSIRANHVSLQRSLSRPRGTSYGCWRPTSRPTSTATARTTSRRARASYCSTAARSTAS